MTYRSLLFLLIVLSVGCQEKKPAEAPPQVPEEVAISCLYIDRCLARLEAEPESELLGDRSAAIVTAAEKTLPAFWGVDPKVLDVATRAKIDAYPARIRKWIDRINELKSKQNYDILKKAVDDHNQWLRENPQVFWQARIDRDQDLLALMQRQMLGMTPGESLEHASREYAASQRQLNDHMRGRFTHYNQVSLQRCHAFISFVLTTTIIKDSTILEEFNKNEIANIDAGLLGTDARRMYDTAVGMMEEKLKARNRADFLLKLTEAKKWPITDF